MKRYEIHEGTDGFIIKDIVTGKHIDDGFDDVFPTKQEALEFLIKEGLNEEEIPYEISRRHHDVDGNYFYIEDTRDHHLIQDEDGDVLTFNSYEEALEEVIEMVDIKEPEVTATAEVKAPIFVVYNTKTGDISKASYGAQMAKVSAYAAYMTQSYAQRVADLLNANDDADTWVVGQIKNVELV